MFQTVINHLHHPFLQFVFGVNDAGRICQYQLIGAGIDYSEYGMTRRLHLRGDNGKLLPDQRIQQG